MSEQQQPETGVPVAHPRENPPVEDLRGAAQEPVEERLDAPQGEPENLARGEDEEGPPYPRLMAAQTALSTSIMRASTEIRMSALQRGVDVARERLNQQARAEGVRLTQPYMVRIIVEAFVEDPK